MKPEELTLLTGEWRMYAETDIPEEWVQKEDGTPAGLPHIRERTKFSPGQVIVREFWKMSGNFCHLTHVREFCHEFFF